MEQPSREEDISQLVVDETPASEGGKGALIDEDEEESWCDHEDC